MRLEDNDTLPKSCACLLRFQWFSAQLARLTGNAVAVLLRAGNELNAVLIGPVLALIVMGSNANRSEALPCHLRSLRFRTA